MNALRHVRSFQHTMLFGRTLALGALGFALFAVAAPAQAGHRGFKIRFSTPREVCAAPASRFEWRPRWSDDCPRGVVWGSWEHGQHVGTEHAAWQGYRDGLDGRTYCDARRLPLHQYPRAFIEGYERALCCAYAPAYRRGKHDRRSRCH